MKLQFLSNKKVFSRRGVILRREGASIKICHMPYCGMDSTTAKELAKWLSKRSKEINIAFKRGPKNAAGGRDGE